MTSPDAPPPLAAGQIEIWKKIVDVQQHFNDLELRIRNFALIVTGAFLGLGGYAIKDAGIINALGVEVSIAGLVVFSAIIPLFAFYFMDRLWYHRLLDGSVQAGIEAEAALKDLGYKVDLGSQISAKSPFSLWPSRTKIHSKTKMDIFYCMLAVALLLVAGFLAFGIRPQSVPISAARAPLVGTASNASNIASPAGTANTAPAHSGVNAMKPPVNSVASECRSLSSSLRCRARRRRGRPRSRRAAPHAHRRERPRLHPYSSPSSPSPPRAAPPRACS